MALLLTFALVLSACSGSQPRPVKKKEEPAAAASEAPKPEPTVGAVSDRPARSETAPTVAKPRPAPAVGVVSDRPVHSESAPKAEASKPANPPANNDALADQVRPLAPVPPSAPPPLPPPPPEPTTRQVTLPLGTLIPIRMIDPVDSATDHVGQTFKASIDAPVSIDSHVVLKRGADVYVKLTEAKSAGNLKGQSELKLQLDRVFVGGKSYTITSNEYQSIGASQTRQTAKTVGVATAIGAAIGAITGGKKGAVIGAGAGAGAGVGIEVATKGEQVRIESETPLEFRLEQPLEVTIDTRPSTSSAVTTKPALATRPGPLSGEWELTMDSPQGRRRVKLVLEQNGSRLQGTMGNPAGGETPIRGSVRGSEVVFDADVPSRGQSVRMEFDGTISGDELRGTLTVMGRKSEWSAERVR